MYFYSAPVFGVVKEIGCYEFSTSAQEKSVYLEHLMREFPPVAWRGN